VWNFDHRVRPLNNLCNISTGNTFFVPLFSPSLMSPINRRFDHHWTWKCWIKILFLGVRRSKLTQKFISMNSKSVLLWPVTHKLEVTFWHVSCLSSRLYYTPKLYFANPPPDFRDLENCWEISRSWYPYNKIRISDAPRPYRPWFWGLIKFLRNFLLEVNYMTPWRNMSKIWRKRNMWEIWRNMWRTWRNMWEIWRNLSLHI